MREVAGWWLPDDDRHFEGHLAVGGSYQSEIRRRGLRHVKKFDVAIDGGAHVGLWSRELCQKFRFVHAFEPVKEHRRCYLKNVSGSNFTLFPFALGEKDRRVGIELLPRNSGGAHVIDGDDARMVTIDSFGFPTVDYIKLDVKSWELYALQGAEETLLRCKPVVCIEQSAHRNNDTTRTAAQEFLEKMGMHEVEHIKKDHVFAWTPSKST